jgi:hypothetical protein
MVVRAGVFSSKKNPAQIVIWVVMVISIFCAGLRRQGWILRLCRPQRVHRIAKHLAPVPVVSKLVKARAGWRKQNHIAGRRVSRRQSNCF